MAGMVVAREVRTVQPPWGLREMSLMACTGCSSSTGQSQPSSSSWATRAVVPTLRAVAYSERLASPMMMCRRRKRPPARGSSRRLRMGRPPKRTRWETSTETKAARWESWKGVTGTVEPLPGRAGTDPELPARESPERPRRGAGAIIPAPAKSCRVTRKGSSPCTMSRLRGETRRQ